MKHCCVILCIYWNMCRSGGFDFAGTLRKIHVQSTFAVGLDLIINSGDYFVLI